MGCIVTVLKIQLGANLHFCEILGLSFSRIEQAHVTFEYSNSFAGISKFLTICNVFVTELVELHHMDQVYAN